jgi:aminocarboxymuconate-semialdehyde decarboxylase
MIIDIHTHVLVEHSFDKLRKKYAKGVPPEIVRDATGKFYHLVNGKAFGPQTEQIYDPKKRIEDMKKEGVDSQLLSVAPYTFGYSKDAELGLALAQAQNDAISNLVGEYPDRFAGLATVPLADVYASVEELDRAVKDLGLKGVEIGTHVEDDNLDSLELWPFYEKAQELDVPILVHPESPVGSERMRKYYLGNFIGNPLETTIAIGSIIFGGVLERFGKLKFCFVHGGGFIPYQRGRFEHGYHVRSEAKVNISKPPSEYLKLIYIDTVTHYQSALEYLINTIGSEKILLGSDYPYDMADPHPVSSVQKLTTLRPEDKQKILGENAERIFKIHT